MTYFRNNNQLLQDQITFVDIDETLFHTFAKIKVMKNGKLVRELSNQEFNSYQLQPGEIYDFGEFRDARLFAETSRPIEQTVELVQRLTEEFMRDDDNRIVFLTARSDFDNKEVFLKTFREVGIEIDLPGLYVERTGNMTDIEGEAVVAHRKKKVVLEYISGGQFRKVRLYDDNRENLEEFLSIQHEIPQRVIQRTRHFHEIEDDVPTGRVIAFAAFHVQADGVAEQIG